ncbi:hypothetical protein EDD16DRAFT_1591179 [Pisolithus croceorrhizus]|nr:hypothetical protein EDD16DRAFT_1591179 [Pisolithus croceorrhizus]KAI6164489.1 hypothetical protein EDD17DRAFT_1872214 [Pisolithus thermaeus]
MVPGCFSALWTWCSRRRSRGSPSKETAVPQTAAPAGATQTNHRDVQPYSVTNSSNVDAPDPAPSQGGLHIFSFRVPAEATWEGFVPSIATPQAMPTAAQMAIPHGSTSAGTSTLGDPAFNPGQAQPGLFPGPQANHVVELADATSSQSSSPDGSPQNHPPNPSWAQGLPNGRNSHRDAAPSTSGAMSSTIVASSSSAVNGAPTLDPAVQATSFTSELPSNFLTAEFMQSVTTSLNDFDPQGLFGPGETGIDFEQFREWFDPPNETDGTNGTRNG